LCAARLYLEDIEEVRRIFIEAGRGHDDPLTSDDAFRTSIRVGNQTCDFDDLRKIHPNSTCEFYLDVSKGTQFHANIDIGKRYASWYSFNLDENEDWGVYHKLETIFETRKVSWKALLHSHSSVAYWVYGASTAAVSILLPPAIVFFNRLPHAITFPILGFLGFLILLIAVLRFGLRSHTVVILKSRSEHASQNREIAWKLIPDAVKIVLGFALGFLTEFIKHRYWP
jgi:hypothetical protein